MYQVPTHLPFAPSSLNIEKQMPREALKNLSGIKKSIDMDCRRTFSVKAFAKVHNSLQNNFKNNPYLQSNQLINTNSPQCQPLYFQM